MGEAGTIGCLDAWSRWRLHPYEGSRVNRSIAAMSRHAGARSIVGPHIPIQQPVLKEW